MCICLSHFSAIPGAVALVREAFGQGLKLAIGSGATRRDLELMLAALQLKECFSVIVSANEVTYSKPDPETYNKAFVGLQTKVSNGLLLSF